MMKKEEESMDLYIKMQVIVKTSQTINIIFMCPLSSFVNPQPPLLTVWWMAPVAQYLL